MQGVHSIDHGVFLMLFLLLLFFFVCMRLCFCLFCCFFRKLILIWLNETTKEHRLFDLQYIAGPLICRSVVVAAAAAAAIVAAVVVAEAAGQIVVKQNKIAKISSYLPDTWIRNLTYLTPVLSSFQLQVPSLTVT